MKGTWTERLCTRMSIESVEEGEGDDGNEDCEDGEDDGEQEFVRGQVGDEFA